MASNSSKALPYLAMLIVFLALVIEVHYGIDVDLEQALPFLMAIGVTGGVIKAVKEASKIKKMLPNEFEHTIKEQIYESEKRMASFMEGIMKDNGKEKTL